MEKLTTSSTRTISKPKFIRKTDSTKASQEKYRAFIVNIQNLSNLSGDNALEEEEILTIIKDSYNSIAPAHIEVNEQFLNALEIMKSEIFEKGDHVVVKSFISVLCFLKRAKLLFSKDFTDLADFKGMKLKTSTSSLSTSTSSSRSSPPSLPTSNALIPIPIKRESPKNISSDRFKELMRYQTGCQSAVPELRALSFEEFKVHINEWYSRDLYNILKPELETEETLKKKMAALEIAEKIYSVVDFADYNPGLSVQRLFYGSSVNRVYTSSSDIDITLATDDEKCDERGLLRFFASQFKDRLEPEESFKIEYLLFPHIKHPLVDIHIKPLGTTISFSVNNKLAAINSKLLEIYSNLDPRCKMLALLVKIWAKIHKISSARVQFLSSYAYNLMVINFLQIVSPAVLPSLQKIREMDKSVVPTSLKVMPRGKDIDNKQPYNARVDYEDNVEKLQQIMIKDYAENNMTVIELLLQFFRAYSDSKIFEDGVISIREGALLDRPFLGVDSSYLYSIEDPFELKHNPGHHVKKNSVQARRILSAMNQSYELLSQNKVLEVFQPFSSYDD